MRLSVLISLRNLYNSLNNIKENLISFQRKENGVDECTLVSISFIMICRLYVLSVSCCVSELTVDEKKLSVKYRVGQLFVVSCHGSK